MGYVVAAGYVTVPTAIEGGVAHVDIPCGAALPDDVPDEHVQVLLDRGHIAEAAQETAAPRKRTPKSTK